VPSATRKGNGGRNAKAGKGDVVFACSASITAGKEFPAITTGGEGGKTRGQRWSAVERQKEGVNIRNSFKGGKRKNSMGCESGGKECFIIMGLDSCKHES